MKLFEPQVMLIILVIVLLVFGPKQLPELGKTIGQTMKSVREGMEGSDDEDEPPAKKKLASASSTEAEAIAEKKVEEAVAE